MTDKYGKGRVRKDFGYVRYHPICFWIDRMTREKLKSS